MTIFGIPILSLLIFFPLLGAAILLFVNKEKAGALRGVTLVFSLIEFIISLPLFFGFDPKMEAMQFVEDYWWVQSYGISYKLGIDGISLLLVMLTTFLTILCILCSWKAITFRVKEFMISFLFLETGMIGALVALDLILFYVFWEVMLIPMYLLIGIWGDPKRRIYAAIKFFLFTMAGSVLMLVAILALYFINQKATGIATFDVLELYKLGIPVGTQYWLFGAFALAFAIKVPMFPFHTWLPDAHTEAPTAGSVILAGVLLKMGTYGFIRFAMPLFPNAAYDLMPSCINPCAHRDYLWCLGLHDAARSETTGCFFKRKPPGICDAWDVRSKYARGSRGNLPDAQSWDQHRVPLLDRWNDL